MNLDNIEKEWKRAKNLFLNFGQTSELGVFTLNYTEKMLDVAKAYKSIKIIGRDHEPFCCCRIDSFEPVDIAMNELEKE